LLIVIYINIYIDIYYYLYIILIIYINFFMSTSYKLSAAAFWKVYFTHLFINNARITNMSLFTLPFKSQ